MCMRHVVIFGLPGCTIFSTLPHKRHNFRKRKVIEHEVCFDFLYNSCLKNFSFWEELSKIWSKMYIELHVKCPLFLSEFKEILIFSRDFRKMLARVCSSRSAVIVLVKILPYPSRHCPQTEFNFCISGNVSYTQIRQPEIHIVYIFSLGNSDCSRLATFDINVLQILSILLPVPQRIPSVLALWTTKLFSLLHFTYWSPFEQLDCHSTRAELPVYCTEKKFSWHIYSRHWYFFPDK